MGEKREAKDGISPETQVILDLLLSQQVKKARGHFQSLSEPEQIQVIDEANKTLKEGDPNRADIIGTLFNFFGERKVFKNDQAPAEEVRMTGDIRKKLGRLLNASKKERDPGRRKVLFEQAWELLLESLGSQFRALRNTFSFCIGAERRTDELVIVGFDIDPNAMAQLAPISDAVFIFLHDLAQEHLIKIRIPPSPYQELPPEVMQVFGKYSPKK